MTSKSGNSRILERLNQRLYPGIRAQGGRHQRPESVHPQPEVVVPGVFGGAQPAFCAVVETCDDAGGWVEAFALRGAEGVQLGEEAGVEEGWEGVGESFWGVSKAYVGHGEGTGVEGDGRDGKWSWGIGERWDGGWSVVCNLSLIHI